MKTLRLLLVEDSADDAQLLLLELRRAGYDIDWERVETAETLTAALTRREWDVVVSDFSMPTLDALAALAIVQRHGLDLPFIIVSGTMGEETAVETMRAGAHDYLLKGHLRRLAPAIERELREAGVRREQRTLREQLLLSDRLASVGMLAAGVAHEVNNPLAAALGNLEYTTALLQELIDGCGKADSPLGAAASAWLVGQLRALDEPLRDSIVAARRIRDIVRDIKSFSRSEVEQLGPIDVRQVLDSALRLAQVELRKRARVVKVIAEVPPVLASEARLSQVFLNLIVNAAQAMEPSKAARNELRLSTQLAGDQVVVEVRDTGSGIPAELQARIFEPFFTTKPKGQGTGLGLPICQGIVGGFGGRIEVESTVGEGSTFRVLLPASALELQRAPAPVVAAAAPGGPRGRVLVIDDEELVGTLIRRTLSPQHAVECLTDPHAALERLAHESFDVVLCDVMMPGLTGIELYEQLSRRQPAVAARLLFLTGGALTAEAQRFLDQHADRAVEKPFDPEALRRLVGQVVARTRAAEPR